MRPMSDSDPTPHDEAAASAHFRHELRTPINQIVGYSELLQEEAQEEGRHALAADLARIAAAGRRLLALIEQGLGTFVAPSGPAGPPAPAAGVEGEDVVELSAGDAAAGGRVLVVDDDAANRDMLARRLARRGHAVSVADSGEAALEMVARQPFDLVLLDVVMSGLSGLQVLERLRRDTDMGELPVIMATARDRSQDTVAALRLGANDYVTKPLDFPVVQARVETQLRLKRAMGEVRRLADELELRNRFIRSTFGRYVSDEIVAALLETPQGLQLGGEKRTVTILMADLRGFSAMAERLGPEQVVATLNNYLGAMTDIITGHQGTIDEFIGDAILALFGAPVGRPDDARRAVACALEMQLAMDAVNAQSRRLGLPELEMGIAINTGEVVVGNVGSHKRAKYGVVGTPVNLAGRIESYTVGGQILVAEATLAQAGPEVAVENRVTIEAKGIPEPVVVYTLRGLGGEGGLRLPATRDEPLSLERAIPVRYVVLEGKRRTGPEHEGRLVALSMLGGEVQGGGAPEPLRDVRLRITGFHGTEVAGELYGKVIAPAGEGFTLRFTSVPPQVAEVFRAALGAGRQA
jgi:class 3 adenylate cyclase